MKKYLLILLFASLVCPAYSFSEQTEIDSSVVSVNPDRDFFIIASGGDSGVDMGDGVIVHRGNKKIAEAYIIEVRPTVSAAEILSVEKREEVRKGDEALIVKKTRAAAKSGTSPSKRPASKWTNILGAESSTPATPPVRTMYPETLQRALPEPTSQGDTIRIEINNDKNSVFSYAGIVLKENGFSIITSNRVESLILAKRPIEMPILKELWADATSAIGHNLVISISIKDQGYSSALLSAASFKEHFQKGKYIKQDVNRDSRYYGGVVKIVSDIKERSEY